MFEFGQGISLINMNAGQTRGMIALVIGFIITIMAGITLSFLTVNVLDTTQTFLAATLTFLVVAPIFGFGIYTYARSTEADVYATNDEMEKPRLLLDILREQGQGDVIILAEQLETTPTQIKSYINDLNQLNLFSGIADWENGVIGIYNPTVIQAIEQCKTCQNPIIIVDELTVCQHCGTAYYTIVAD